MNLVNILCKLLCKVFGWNIKCLWITIAKCANENEDEKEVQSLWGY